MNPIDFNVNSLTQAGSSTPPQGICLHCKARFGFAFPPELSLADQYRHVTNEMTMIYHTCPGVENAENLRAIRKTLEMLAALFASDSSLINFIDERVRERLSRVREPSADINAPDAWNAPMVSGSPLPGALPPLPKA